MQQDQQRLEYPFPQSPLISHDSLRIVDATLLAALGRWWEQMLALSPHNQRASETRPYSPQELRSSPLGQALLTIAHSESSGMVSPQKVQRAMKQAYRILFGNGLGEGYTIPPAFHATELGILFHTVSARLYGHEQLLTPKQAYDLLGVARQTLYDRLYKAKLTPVYLHGELRFLRTEIEEWKRQREHRAKTKATEQ